MRTLAIAAAALVATSCTTPFPPRACNVDDDCLQAGIDGFCLPSPRSDESWCAYPDATCTASAGAAAPLRWGIRAGDALSETCVEAADAGVPDAFIADAGPDACIPVAEICDGLDSDCDGIPDNGCPGEIATAFPWNGYTTGSVWGTAGALVSKPLRPTFRWAAATEATTYQIQLDDSCTTATFSMCDFPSPEVDQVISTTSFAPAVDLPVSTINPVGRRYFWRVRACSPLDCSAWIQVRYLDVGRLRDDFNGDGYSDVVVGAFGHDTSGMDSGRAYVYLGGLPMNTFPDATLGGSGPGDGHGGGVAAAGDLNADGFADLAIGRPGSDVPGSDAGQVFVLFGGPGTPLNTSVEGVLSGEGPDDHFGENLAGAGDVNGDGYSDLLVGTFVAGRAYVYLGSFGGSFETTADYVISDTNLGWAVDSAGDVNGDGLADIIVGTPYDDLLGANAGGANIYLGGSPMDVLPDWHFDGEYAGDESGSEVAGLGDVNADGFADVIVGSWKNSVGGNQAGRAYMFLGGTSVFG